MEVSGSDGPSGVQINGPIQYSNMIITGPSPRQSKTVLIKFTVFSRSAFSPPKEWEPRQAAQWSRSRGDIFSRKFFFPIKVTCRNIPLSVTPTTLPTLPTYSHNPDFGPGETEDRGTLISTKWPGTKSTSKYMKFLSCFFSCHFLTIKIPWRKPTRIEYKDPGGWDQQVRSEGGQPGGGRGN